MDLASVTWTDIGTFAVAVATLATLIGAVFVAWHQLRLSRKATQVQLMADISRRWDEELLAQSRYKIASYTRGEGLLPAVQRLIENNDPEYYELVRIPNFFEDLKILADHGGVTFTVVRESLGSTCIYYWKEWEASVKYLREYLGTSRVYVNFQELAACLEQDIGVAVGNH